MHRWIGLIGMLLLLCGAAKAQDIRIVDSIYFRSEVQSDGGRYLPFGVGSIYTDGVDPGTRDFEVPFAPPSGLYALMIKDDGAYYEGDLRAVPDSVSEEGAKRFSLTYKVHLQRGAGRKIIIDFVRPFAPGIDSVNMRDLLTGTLFNRTFLTGVSEDTLHVEGITQLQVTVYYNLQPSSVDYVSEGLNAGRLAPNPVSLQEGIRYSGELPRGAVLIINDLAGQTVTTIDLAETSANGIIRLPSMAPSVYFCMFVDDQGRVIDRESIIVNP